MDGGTFYGRGSRLETTASHFSSFSAHPSWLPADGQAYFPPSETAINQKLDRVVTLLEAQGKETEKLKSEVAALRDDVERLKKEEPATSRSRATPTSSKLPTELSVSLSMCK